ncbi:MAG: M56 family metallopeptidase, partial [Planctomycetota bacterium]
MEGYLLFLVDLTTRATVLLLAALILTLLMRRATAALRHATWALALGGILALPFLVFLLPRWPLPVLSRGVSPVTEVVGPVNGTPSAIPPVAVPATRKPHASSGRATPSARGPEKPRKHERGDASALTGPAPGQPRPGFWSPVLLGLWVLGGLLFAIRLLRGLGGAAGLVRRARVPKDASCQQILAEVGTATGLRRPVSLRLSSEIPGPLTWGLLHPVVLLPVDVQEWSLAKRRTVLIHELSHVRRMDCAVQLLGCVAMVLYWFHPLVWLAKRRLHLEQERACDDAVVALGCRPSDYAGHLMEVSRSFRPAQLPAPVATAVATPSELMARMTYLLDNGRVRGGLSRFARV